MTTDTKSDERELCERCGLPKADGESYETPPDTVCWRHLAMKYSPGHVDCLMRQLATIKAERGALRPVAAAARRVVNEFHKLGTAVRCSSEMLAALDNLSAVVTLIDSALPASPPGDEGREGTG